MANTYTLIASNTLSSSAASVIFSAIPNTYTDLVLKMSVKTSSTSATGDLYVQINSATSTYSYTRIYGAGGGGYGSDRSAGDFPALYSSNVNGNSSVVTNVFANVEFYIPSYAGNKNKVASQFSAQERNDSLAYIESYAHSTDITAAISSLKIEGNGTNLVSGSSFFLYGIKNS